MPQPANEQVAALWFSSLRDPYLPSDLQQLKNGNEGLESRQKPSTSRSPKRQDVPPWEITEVHPNPAPAPEQILPALPALPTSPVDLAKYAASEPLSNFFFSSLGKQLWQTSYGSNSTQSTATSTQPDVQWRSKDDQLNYDLLYAWTCEFVQAEERQQKEAAREQPKPEPKPMQRNITTLMVKNVPNRVRVEQLIDKLTELGFKGRCDYVYMPMDWQTHANKGFGFANFITPEDAVEFATLVEGSALFGCSGSGKRMTTSPASRQGVVENLRSVSYTCRKDKVNFPWVLIGDALIGMRPSDALERWKRKDQSA